MNFYVLYRNMREFVKFFKIILANMNRLPINKPVDPINSMKGGASCASNFTARWCRQFLRVCRDEEGLLT